VFKKRFSKKFVSRIKSPWLLILAFLFNIQVGATSIIGKVTDNAGAAIPYASVFVKNNKQGVTANANGEYQLNLTPGFYTIICQHVGFAKQEKDITLTAQTATLNFILEPQVLTLSEVRLGEGEDPAYGIIRSVIASRVSNLKKEQHFSCEVYSKSQMRLRDFPGKFLGNKVDFEDGDTSKKKIIYLSETVSKYWVDKPKNEKVEVISSRTSGSGDGFGLAVPTIFSLYENSVQISPQLNPRGFISPIAEQALQYYKYKLLGSFTEDGQHIFKIKVTPKRKFEPLFAGYINVVDERWTIHSSNLLLTKESQLQILDTLRIEQLYKYYNDSISFLASQVVYPAFKKFGFEGYGSFVNVYSGYNIESNFASVFKDKIILKYQDSSNRKTIDYWNVVRPIPLAPDEMRDFVKKDSLAVLRKSAHYQDSINKKNNKFTVSKFLLFGYTIYQKEHSATIYGSSMINQLSFNPAEGLVLSPQISVDYLLDSTPRNPRKINIATTFRYGVLNKHFNPSVKISYRIPDKYAEQLNISFGKSVYSFSPTSTISELANSLSCLLEEKNRIKTYEASFFLLNYTKGFNNGFSVSTSLSYQHRTPLENLTDYTWRDRAGSAYTPNYPYEISATNIAKHQALSVSALLRWQPGNKYVQYPERKISVGSDNPVFTLQLKQALPNLLGSDASYSKWKFDISDQLNLKLKGVLRYRVALGGFLSKKEVPLPDFNHYNGNISNLAATYLNSFQLMPLYAFSNTDAFAEGHIEYNMKGFITNKIPLIRRLNCYLVTGINSLYVNSNKNYIEYFIGADNLFKQFRIDWYRASSKNNTSGNTSGVRVGIKMFQ
jgi:hypothetical protein